MANSLTAYNPQWWANESVALLVENLVASQLVHTNFKNEIARSGDIVNTRVPAEFTAVRKVDSDSITDQDASATNIAVPLDQHWHTAFILKDGELSKSFKDLRTEFLEPAITSLAQAMDKVIHGQVYQFIGNTEGKCGDWSSTTAKGYILDAHRRMNINKVPVGRGRNMLLTPTMEAEALKLDIFTSAEQVGDGGTALQEAMLGRKLGFNMFMCQNAPSITGQEDASASASLVDNSGGYAAGETTVHIDTAGSNVTAGMWIRIAGDDTPQHITAIANLATEDLDLTISPGLRRAVADNATTKIYSTGAVAQAVSPTGYAAGWSKEIVCDGFTGSAIEVGEVITFAATTTKYAVVAVSETSSNTTGLTLDKPLVAAIADNAIINTGPAGEFSMVSDRPAITLVSRPLALPEGDLGAKAAVANFAGYGLRVVMAYDRDKQGIGITVDILSGIQTLNANRGVLLCG